MNSQPSTPQPSTIPGGHCLKCSAELPPFKPDGTRPSHICPDCQMRLYPPDTTFDRCPSCDYPQAIRPSGERFSPHCDQCRQMLPPPGQRFLSACPGCGLKLSNYNLDGVRFQDRCPDCRTPLPLLEPIPPPPATPKSDEAGPAAPEHCEAGPAAPEQREGGSTAAPPALAA